MTTDPRPLIVCATDLSDTAEATLDAAIELAVRYDVNRLYALYVREEAERFETAKAVADEIDEERAELEALMKAELARMQKAIGGPPVEIVPVLRHGRSYREILRFVCEVRADYVVVGSHGSTGFEHALLGSVAERVVRKAPCNVLVAKSVAVTAKLARTLQSLAPPNAVP